MSPGLRGVGGRIVSLLIYGPSSLHVVLPRGRAPPPGPLPPYTPGRQRRESMHDVMDAAMKTQEV